MDIRAKKILYTKEKSPLEFKFDNLMAPPILAFLTQYDIDRLRYYATSLKYAGDTLEVQRQIDIIMKARGWKKMTAGTNRVVYRHLEDTSVVMKVAFREPALNDSLAEFRIQHLLKPFVSKVFDVSQCGTVALCERVKPITNLDQFMSVADDIFDLIVYKIIGKYVLEDIGVKFFMNWGLRELNGNGGNFGPVLLDYPYVYELDGNKLQCNALMSDKITHCGGMIDYDNGFNYLICDKCGKRYYAKNLQSFSKEDKINVIRKGADIAMRVQIEYNGKVEVYESGTNTIVKPQEIVPAAKVNVPKNVTAIIELPNGSVVDTSKNKPKNQSGGNSNNKPFNNKGKFNKQRKPSEPIKVDLALGKSIEDAMKNNTVKADVETDDTKKRWVAPEILDIDENHDVVKSIINTNNENVSNIAVDKTVEIEDESTDEEPEKDAEEELSDTDIDAIENEVLNTPEEEVQNIISSESIGSGATATDIGDLLSKYGISKSDFDEEDSDEDEE